MLKYEQSISNLIDNNFSDKAIEKFLSNRETYNDFEKIPQEITDHIIVLELSVPLVF